MGQSKSRFWFGQDSGDGPEDYGADAVQWPSHQSHDTTGYEDESQDGSDAGAGLFVDGMGEVSGKQTACFHRGRSYSLPSPQRNGSPS